VTAPSSPALPSVLALNRSFANCYVKGLKLAPPQYFNRCWLAYNIPAEVSDQVFVVGCRLAGDADEDIAYHQASFRSRAASFYIDGEQARGLLALERLATFSRKLHLLAA
jgi:hypothetical protein